MCRHPHLLADHGITGEHIGIFEHGKVGRCALSDLEHTSPFAEAGPVLLVLSTALVQAVQPWGINSKLLTLAPHTAGVSVTP